MSTSEFYGVGVQYYNSKSDRAIKNIINMDRTFIVHVSLHWKDRGVDDLSLWSFSVGHTVWY